jgi:hypothetical protein
MGNVAAFLMRRLATGLRVTYRTRSRVHSLWHSPRDRIHVAFSWPGSCVQWHGPRAQETSATTSSACLLRATVWPPGMHSWRNRSCWCIAEQLALVAWHLGSTTHVRLLLRIPARPNPRSSGAPTAGHASHQALGLRPILRLLSSASCRCPPLSSNVRPHQLPHTRLDDISVRGVHLCALQ